MALSDQITPLLQKAQRLSEQYDLPGKAQKYGTQALEKVADYTTENRTKVQETLAKAAATVDQRTGGKYTDKLDKAQAAAGKGLDKLAEQRTKRQDPTDPSA